MFLLQILVFKEFAELFEDLYLLMLCDAYIVVMFVMTIFKKCPFLLVLTSEIIERICVKYSGSPSPCYLSWVFPLDFAPFLLLRL